MDQASRKPPGNSPCSSLQFLLSPIVLFTSFPRTGLSLFKSLRSRYAAWALIFEAQSNKFILAQSPCDQRVQFIWFSSLRNHRPLLIPVTTPQKGEVFIFMF